MRTRTLRAIVLAAILPAVLAACAPHRALRYPTVPPDPSNPIKTVAVLPIINNTNDVDAPGYIREELVARMQALQYAVKPTAHTDQLLRDRMGITLGAQLDMTTPQQVGRVLGVDGVVYGVLDDFSTTLTGVLTEKKVRARFALVKTTDGAQFWANGAGVIGRIKVSGGVTGKVATGLEAGSRVQAAKETAQEAKKAAGGEATRMLPGGLDGIATPWITLPSVEIGGEKAGRKGKREKKGGGGDSEGEKVVEGMLLGLGEKLVEKAVGRPLFQEVRLMMDLIVRPDRVAAAEAAALQRLERKVAGGTTTKEQIAMEIVTKATELSAMRALRPLPVGPGVAGFGAKTVQEPAEAAEPSEESGTEKP
ncbi:MAG: DUF799 family lipoprotein [Nitrospirae bacterium]|nr:DUF799 family lipoprotein [Nitrospirota bacterium]